MTKDPESSTPGRRTVDKVRALSQAQISAHHIIIEQLNLIGQALKTNSAPAFYLLETAQTPAHNFTVIRGTETMTDEVRLALAAGLWPGPPETVSPLVLLNNPKQTRIVAASLWGGPDGPGPWDQFWRERNVRRGLYAVFISRTGRIGVMLASRGNDAPPFDSAEVAFVQACAPYVEAALDRHMAAGQRLLVPADGVYLRFAADGTIAAMNFAGREFLRDLGAGGPTAIADAIARVEQVNRELEGLAQPNEAAIDRLALAGAANERAFRSAMFDLALRPTDDPNRRGAWRVLADNAFGRFEINLITLVGLDGALERFGVLTRHVPPLRLRLRGAIGVQASAREIQLLCALNEGASLREAGAAIGVRRATARTLGERLTARIGASGLSDALDRLLVLGRARDG